MIERLNDAKKYVEAIKDWDKKIAIFGAGKIGTGWGYDLITRLSGKNVDFYVDNNRAGETVLGIEIKSADYLKENDEETLCFVAMAEDMANEVIGQIKNWNIAEVIKLTDESIMTDVEQYLIEYTNEETQLKFHTITDDREFLKYKYEKVMHKELNFDSVHTFNEKMQWLKVYEHKDIMITMADKLAVREYIKNVIGEEYLAPLLYKTDDYKNISLNDISDEHCIIKSNCGCHDYFIVRDKKNIDIECIRNKYKKIFEQNYYYNSREWHYKNIKPFIIIEKLLETKAGKIPNDYKLTFFNGELQYIYCSIDREGDNYRKIYMPDWTPAKFSQGSPLKENQKYPEIAPPKSLDDMIAAGKEIAKVLKYVRADFYDVDGKMYFGEITLCHGAGYDRFYPDEYDEIIGAKLILD